MPLFQINQNGEGFKFDWAAIKEKLQGTRSREVPLEINLVPDIKNEMLRTLKLRNFIFFLCIVIASASLGTVAVFASIAGGQQAIVNSKKDTIANLSNRLNSYSDLGDFLTIKGQLSNISGISNNKKLLSRIFSTLSALLPTNGDSITISEMSVNLSQVNPTISFDAQANANNPPYIDYNVLDSFKKSMQYMRYDYGTYVDKEGAAIPAYCIIENGTDGATLSDPEKGVYAYWLITGDGCNPSYVETDDDDDSTNNSSTSTSTSTETGDSTTSTETDEDGNTITTTTTTTTITETTITTETPEEEAARKAAEKLARQTRGYEVEEWNGTPVVRIWRTPQYRDWYREDANSSQPTMTIGGDIYNVAHFESACINYSGSISDTTGALTWTSDNDCLLVPDGIDGIAISDSSNGRGSNDELVLRFSAVITLNPEVFKFTNKHVLAIGPTGRHNVTDSYVQIQNMFGERASDCPEGDTACYNNSNIGGN